MDGWMDGCIHHGMTIERDKLQGINPLCKVFDLLFMDANDTTIMVV